MSDKKKYQQRGIRGAALTFNHDPFLSSDTECYSYIEDALIVIEDGKIAAFGKYKDVIDRFPHLSAIDYFADSVIIPGLVDCHSHYVQLPMIGSCGDTLLEWLNEYTFPVEQRFSDKKYAQDIAKVFFKQILQQGTTTVNVFATTYPESVDAFFEESMHYGMRVICGKVLQDRNVPDKLRDRSAEDSIIVSERLLKKWHGRDRLLYAVIPRFAPTSTPLQLRLAGELYQQYAGQGVYMHTHLDEAENEIEWVKSLFPDARSYTDVYRRFNLLGNNSVMAHCCVVKEEEWQMLYDYGCSIVHCPSSNLFLGDGEFKYWEAKNPARPLNVGIGTDVGGGTNLSVLRQLGDAYKVAMLRGKSLDVKKSLYLATLGGASALRLSHRIGRVAEGYEADLAVINLVPSEFAEWRMQECSDIFEKLFVLLTLSPENLIRATYIGGKKVYDSSRDKAFLYADGI